MAMTRIIKYIFLLDSLITGTISDVIGLKPAQVMKLSVFISGKQSLTHSTNGVILSFLISLFSPASSAVPATLRRFPNLEETILLLSSLIETYGAAFLEISSCRSMVIE